MISNCHSWVENQPPGHVRHNVFPEGSTIRVAIQGFPKSHYRPVKVHGPHFFGARLRREAYPCFSAFQVSLCVGLLGIGYFYAVPGEAAVAVGRARGGHVCRAATQVLEHSNIPVLVYYSVPLENGSPLELPVFLA